MEQASTSNAYLLLDSHSDPLARGTLVPSPDPQTRCIRIWDGLVDAVAEAKEVQLLSLSEQQTSFLGHVVRTLEDRVILEPLRSLSQEIRENLRMPVDFSSLIYPLTGSWRGQRAIRAMDLSCGGISFSCQQPLAEGEQLELVIPITRDPLIVNAQVLRQRVDAGKNHGNFIYATKFVDLCNGQETLIREAVFGVQLNSRTGAHQSRAKERKMGV